MSAARPGPAKCRRATLASVDSMPQASVVTVNLIFSLHRGPQMDWAPQPIRRAPPAAFPSPRARAAWGGQLARGKRPNLQLVQGCPTQTR